VMREGQITKILDNKDASQETIMKFAISAWVFLINF
jgi:ABC-type sugar transport system ATPase subunit